MNDEKQAAASLVTPPGSGGIAVIDVRGPGAGEIVAAVFAPKSGRDWLAEPAGRLHYGHVRDGGEIVDEVLVRLAARGDGAGAVEVNCHGGIVAAGEVMRLLVEAGAVELPPAAFADRAAADAGLDRVQAAALERLPAAETRLAVRVLCDQLDGALSRAVDAIDLAAPDAAGRLDSLAASAGFGKALTRPRRVALVGSPNAGKSTLFNALVGHNRTIVSAAPGTTRDFINEFIALGGYPLELIDTAGLRRHGGIIEMKGVEATWGVVSDADLIVIVADGSRAMTDSERELARAMLPRAPILALNKSDIAAAPNEWPDAGGAIACIVSALTGDGLPELERVILQRFPDPAAYPPGAAVALTEEHENALEQAGARCRSGQAGLAAAELAALLA